jgi:hypothetical protein
MITKTKIPAMDMIFLSSSEQETKKDRIRNEKFWRRS